MFRCLNHRIGHHVLLLAVAAALALPNLGGPSLWDIDEGNNAEAAREMMESDNWVIPTFNYQLRVDKPALLYWLQIGAYQVCGVNEFAARLPSALAALITVLLTYELGRRMFNPATGLLAGLVLASAIAFCVAAHFANPDALLNACTVLTLLTFWHGFASNRPQWFVLAGTWAGLAVLAKGPVGLVLPAAVVGLFLLWSRRLHALWDRRLLLAGLAFALVALPWYAWVSVDTKAAFLRGFLEKHNVGRYVHAMENHRGPVYYYLGVLVVGLAPWSAFLGPAAWYALGKRARQDETASAVGDGLPLAYRFLWCWIAVYLIFFSLAATKLPNYILPVYAPTAVLLARFLDRWRCGSLQVPNWALRAALASLAVMGLGIDIGLRVAGGAVTLPGVHTRTLSGLDDWAFLGALLIAGAVGAAWFVRRRQRTGAVVWVAGMALVFVSLLAAWGSNAVDQHKAPRALVRAAGVCQTDHEVRVGCYGYFQPSLVFYCRREVQTLANDEQAIEFLRCPLPVYLFLPASLWEILENKVSGCHRLLARHYDLYRRCEVVVVGNR
jgi:4-amino-4-deoxy-L-arabinose transferase-like glycosyltransferase